MWAAFSPDFRACLTHIFAAFEGAGAGAMAMIVPKSTWCSPTAWHSRSRKPSHTSSTKSSSIPTDVLLNSYRPNTILPPASSTKPKSSSSIDPNLTLADRLVLHALLEDARSLNPCPGRSKDAAREETSNVQTLDDLAALSNPDSIRFRPVVFTTWDFSEFPPWFSTYVLQPYVAWASTVVRHRSDVVFLTYILVLFAVGIPNLVLLFLHFNWFQAVFQWALATYFVGPYSILLHNHIHGRGVMSKPWALVDTLFPYILGPMMGQTWNSFYYHHKHHHVEENGPEDLSSTLRYQRDSAFDLALYISRFVFLIWFELPLYYIRKGKPSFAFKFFACEMMSYAFIALLATVNFAAAMTALVLPLIQWRVAIMANNWGQHAFIDEDEPDSNLRCSITLIDVVANRYGFNDGYHTSHHLLPARHWREQPHAFLKAKKKFSEGRALTFQKVDFIKLTYFLLRKEYNYIAECLVPMGDQIGKTNEELAAMLRRKTRKFSEQSIREKFQ